MVSSSYAAIICGLWQLTTVGTIVGLVGEVPTIRRHLDRFEGDVQRVADRVANCQCAGWKNRRRVAPFTAPVGT